MSTFLTGLWPAVYAGLLNITVRTAWNIYLTSLSINHQKDDETCQGNYINGQ